MTQNKDNMAIYRGYPVMAYQVRNVTPFDTDIITVACVYTYCQLPATNYLTPAQISYCTHTVYVETGCKMPTELVYIRMPAKVTESVVISRVGNRTAPTSEITTDMVTVK